MWARMEPGEQRGHRSMPLQALLSITSQRPSSHKFGVGTWLIHRLIHYWMSSTKCGSWHRGGTSTKSYWAELNCYLLYLSMMSTEQISGHLFKWPKDINAIWLLESRRTKSELAWGWGGLSVETFLLCIWSQIQTRAQPTNRNATPSLDMWRSRTREKTAPPRTFSIIIIIIIIIMLLATSLRSLWGSWWMVITLGLDQKSKHILNSKYLLATSQRPSKFCWLTFIE